MSTRRNFLLQTLAAGMTGAALNPVSQAAPKSSRRAGKSTSPVKAAAVIFPAQDQVTLGELDVPPPAVNEIQVRSLYSTISAGTESLILNGRAKWTPFPCVPGYQRSGVVTAVGADVQGWKVGDRALALTSTWSNKDVAPASGAHVALANTPVDQAYPLMAGVDDIDASCGVVAQVGYNAANRAIFNKGDWIVVYGDGLVGQCGAQAARAKGARVLVVGRRRDRLELALQHSADVVINNKEEAAVAAVRKAVGAETVPVIIDTVQSLDSQKEYLDLLERGRGQIVYSGYSPGVQWADLQLLDGRELTTHFIAGWTRERMEATLDLMSANKMHIRPLITHRVSYTRAPEMYRMITQKDVAFLGITLDWQQSS